MGDANLPRQVSSGNWHASQRGINTEAQEKIRCGSEWSAAKHIGFGYGGIEARSSNRQDKPQGRFKI